VGVWSLAALFLALPSSAVGDEVMAGTERETVLGALTAYHAALRAGKPAEVLERLGSSYFMADERSSGGAERLRAHLYLTGSRLRSWPAAFLSEVGPYRTSSRCCR
jgi:hypothetical protein